MEWIRFWCNYRTEKPDLHLGGKKFLIKPHKINIGMMHKPMFGVKVMNLKAKPSSP